MDRIIALVGESGSGKTTIALELEKLGYNFIESFTTRKPRYEGERGHIFIEDIKDSEDFVIWDAEAHPKENVIAYTYYENEHYWSTKEQYQDKGTSIYIVDTVGVKELKENVNDAEIIIIYLKCDELKRTRRMVNRKFGTDEWQLVIDNDILERLEHDTEAFKLIECNYCIDANRPLEEVLELVKQVIEGEKHE